MITETVYRIPGPASLTVALVADTHNTAAEPILASLRTRRPQIIAVAGDLLNGYHLIGERLIVQEQENVLKLVSGCAAIAPTYISLGNHDGVLSADDIGILESTGAVALDNRFEAHGGGEQIVIGGLTSAAAVSYHRFREKTGERYPDRPRHARPAHPETDSAWLDEFERQDEYKILLSHHPEYWALREPRLKERRIDLVLSGHAHGGQVRLFRQGLYAPGQGWFPRFTGGVFRGEHGSLVVSRGLANIAWAPRLFNPPEIVYIELYGR